MENLTRCAGIVLLGRNATGGRLGLLPPRRCRAAAIEGEAFCASHKPQAALQRLLGELLVYGWESRVASFMREQERVAAREKLTSRFSIPDGRRAR